jgi:hypothetical protein
MFINKKTRIHKTQINSFKIYTKKNVLKKRSNTDHKETKYGVFLCGRRNVDEENKHTIIKSFHMRNTQIYEIMSSEKSTLKINTNIKYEILGNDLTSKVYFAIGHK